VVASWSSASRRSRLLKSVCAGPFYVGRHKGVGKVWQITACDAASSYGLAGLLPAHEAAAAAMFLRDVVSRSRRRRLQPCWPSSARHVVNRGWVFDTDRSQPSPSGTSLRPRS
jgi:hypothetical protein